MERKRVFNFPCLAGRQKFSIFNSERGQALLIIVLVMVVVLTAGLSLALRSVTNLRTTTEEENSQRAFFAAEAGIEQALKLNQTGSVIENKTFENNATIRKVNVTDVAGSIFVLNGGNPVRKDDGVDVWLAPRNADGTVNDATPFTGNISIYWGVQTVLDACTQAAIEVVTLSGTKTSPVSTRYTFDECDARRANNRFSDSDVPGDSLGVCTRFPYKATIPEVPRVIDQGLIARIIPLYSDSPFCIVASGPLPSQGRIIESVGVAGGTERKVLLFQGHPKVPAELFQYILFSPR